MAWTKWAVVLVALSLGGCGVRRQMVMTSNPTGVLVYLNGQEIGRTPLTHDFLWYGNYSVVLRKDGYKTARTTTNVKAPWWQWIPIDLVAELLPVPLRDRHHFTYTLLPASTQPADAELMLENAAEYRAKLGLPATTKP